MLEGLWSIRFESNIPNLHHWGNGIVVWETQRILGGDSQFYYIGNYIVKDAIVTGDLEITAFCPVAISVLGPSRKIKFQGKVISGNQIVCHGSATENPEIKIKINCEKRSGLPNP